VSGQDDQQGAVAWIQQPLDPTPAGCYDVALKVQAIDPARFDSLTRSLMDLRSGRAVRLVGGALGLLG
jgi:hypothetical protein